MRSRSKKSKVMGLGLRQDREDWPEEVGWLKPVKEIKVLGFMVCQKYSETQHRTWERVF